MELKNLRAFPRSRGQRGIRGRFGAELRLGFYTLGKIQESVLERDLSSAENNEKEKNERIVWGGETVALSKRGGGKGSANQIFSRGLDNRWCKKKCANNDERRSCVPPLKRGRKFE